MRARTKPNTPAAAPRAAAAYPSRARPIRPRGAHFCPLVARADAPAPAIPRRAWRRPAAPLCARTHMTAHMSPALRMRCARYGICPCQTYTTAGASVSPFLTPLGHGPRAAPPSTHMHAAQARAPAGPHGTAFPKPRKQEQPLHAHMHTCACTGPRARAHAPQRGAAAASSPCGRMRRQWVGICKPLLQFAAEPPAAACVYKGAVPCGDLGGGRAVVGKHGFLRWRASRLPKA